MIKKGKPAVVKTGGNKLTLDSLQKIDKKNDEVKTIKVNGYPIKVNKFFRDTKIQVLLGEFVMIHEELKNMGVPVEEMDFTGIVYGLTFKHFSDLPVPKNTAGLIQYVSLLIDNGFHNEILKHYDMTELAKLAESMKNSVKNAETILETISKEKSE